MRLSRLVSADAGLALLVVAVVGMMIVPLPTWLLDGLLALNLSAAVTVLLVALYAPHALSIATFPTLLLLTTLFRLALNVSATRLILLTADAGDVIRAFGRFVVRGNYVVGAIVFLILTIIQFVVIAKGSERVAEVGARFVLDAMPGKQMAIDAELRSGAIDTAEARRRRRALARESQFYGAMDGAMKFVRGDVIASLVIIVVNLLGGLAIGVGQKDLAVGEALKRYGLLTIGEGLVAQIPALVLSTAAGVLVTRVASEEGDTPLGTDLARQLFSDARALRAAAFFVALLGVVPGLPLVPFAVVGMLLFLASRRAEAAKLRREREARAGAAERTAFMPVVDAWSVVTPAGVDEEFVEALGVTLERVRGRVFEAVGVPLPPPVVRPSAAVAAGTVVWHLREVPELTLPAADTSALVPFGPLEDALVEAMERRSAQLLGIAETQRLLDELESTSPAVVRAVVPKPISVALLTEVLQRLVAERVSIRDLPLVLQALGKHGAVEKDALLLAERVRHDLRRAITHRLTGGEAHLGVVTLEPSLEDAVRQYVVREATGFVCAMPPQARRDLVKATKRAVEAAAGSHEARVVVATGADVRPFVFDLVALELPNVAVVCSDDLTAETKLAPLAQATLAALD